VRVVGEIKSAIILRVLTVPVFVLTGRGGAVFDLVVFLFFFCFDESVEFAHWGKGKWMRPIYSRWHIVSNTFFILSLANI
jgi:hypothetical protein